MANRIKGITIEIGGDTTKLQKSLSGVDKSLKTTQSNLRDINKLLKLDPGNTELLTQKQKNLEQAISDTKDRLKQLKDAQKDVKQGTDDWDALQREIAATEQDLKGLESEYKDFGSVAKQQLKAVSEKTKAVGKKMQDIGGSLTKNVTAPIVAVGAASVAAFNEVDKGEDIIIKKTGATGEQAEELRKIMENIATTIPTDFETAGSAIGEVSTRFGLVGQDLEDLSAKFIKFADLNNTDVSAAIDSVQAAMEAFNVETEDAGEFLDLLNKAGQDTGISMDELTSSLLTNATALTELGFGANESVGFLANLEKSGIDSSAMLSGLKTALKNATKEGKPMRKALIDLQKDLQSTGTDTEATQQIMELFGNKAGPAIAKAVSEGKLNLLDLGTTITDFGNSVDQTFEATQDPIDSFTTTLNTVKLTGAELGATILEVLAPVLQDLADAVSALKEKWDELDPATQEAIVKAALVAAAIGPVVTIAGTLAMAIGALLSPIGAVIAIIAGVVAAGVALYKNWDKICEWAGNVKKQVSEAWEQLKENVGKALQPLKENVLASWEDIKTGVTNAATNIKETVSEKFTNIKNTVSEKLSSAKQTVSEKWADMKQTVSEKASLMASTVSEKFGSIKTKISDKLGEAKDKVTEIFGNIKQKIEEKLGDARDFVSGAIDKIKGFFNFEWSLPHLKMPHFSITGEFSLKPPSVPHLSVEWYKKAYDTPYLFTTPTIVNGRGFGDGNGGEIVYGRDQLMRDIAAATGDEITVNVYAAEGMNVNELADKVIQKINFTTQQRARVYA